MYQISSQKTTYFVITTLNWNLIQFPKQQFLNFLENKSGFNSVLSTEFTQS